MPSRMAFGDIKNSMMAKPPHFMCDPETEVDMFFGVSKPFFSNTYKKREMKIRKKQLENNVRQSVNNQENKPEKKVHVETENKKEKPKSRTQKNSQQKHALQLEFQKDSTWSNSQCKRISQQTGLSVAQVYKWGWDKKNRISAARQGHGADSMPGMMPLVLGDSEFMMGPPHQ